MNIQKLSLNQWLEAEKENDKQIAYAFSDRDKKHIMVQTYGKIIAELWKLTPPKFPPVVTKIVLNEHPELKKFPKDLAFLLYYSIKSTQFIWNSVKPDYPQTDTTTILSSIPGYQETKEKFEKKYGAGKEDKNT